MTIDAMQFFFKCVGTFFILYLIGYASFLFLSVTVGSSTLYGAKRRNFLKNELKNHYYIPVSVIVPAYNEEITIEATVRSLLALDYKLYEIIVVDDGSSDRTAQVLKETFSMHRIHRPVLRRIDCRPLLECYETTAYKVPIVLVKKENGGKADALNMGINLSRYPFFLCLDADSVLQKDSLEKIVRPILEKKNVVAVGGAVRPGNGTVLKDGEVVSSRLPGKILSCMQVLEYDRSFLAARIFLDQFNGNLIASGAFSLFRKSSVIAAGGYDQSTMGEDMELILKLHVFCRENRQPYRICYAADAICWTQVPESLRDLKKQRQRWHIGLFQSLMTHKKILGNPKYGLVSYISYIYYLIYELFSPYIEIFGVFTMALAYFLDFLNLPFMLLFLGIYIAYSAILSLTAFFARIHTIDLKLSAMDVLKAVGLCVLEVSCLRFILAWIRATALIGHRNRQWGQIKRKKIEFKE